MKGTSSSLVDSTPTKAISTRKEPHASPPRPILYRFPTASSASSHASSSSDGFYFEDVPRSPSLLISPYTSPSLETGQLGDFLFEDEEEYRDYFNLIASTSSASSPLPQYQSTRQQRTKTHKQARFPPSYYLDDSTIKVHRPSQSLPALLYATSSTRRESSPVPATSPQPSSQPVSKSVSDPGQCALSSSLALSPTQRQGAPDGMPVETNNRFERALQFAKWSKRGRRSSWQAPNGVSQGLIKLVSSTEE